MRCARPNGPERQSSEANAVCRVKHRSWSLIVEHVGDAIERLVDKLATDLDQIESNLATGRHKGERAKLTQARQAAAKLHRQLSGLRALFHRLERDGTEHVKPGLQLSAGALAQRLDALDHDIVETRHRAQLLQEEIAAATAEETNRNLHVLAVVTALFLPRRLSPACSA